MSSRANANRRNAIRSTGPRTAAGKAISSMNATRHGLRSVSPVVPGIERAEDWEHHRNALWKALEPLGALEEVLAERIALLLWRLGRVIRHERDVITLAIEAVPDELRHERELARLTARSTMAVMGLGMDDDPRSDLVDNMDHPDDVSAFAKEARRERIIRERLLTEPNETRIPGGTAASVLYRAEEVLVSSLGAQVNLDDVSLHGIPPETPLEEFEPWTAGLLRHAIAALGAAGERNPDELLSATLESARWAERSSAFEARRVRADLERLRRRRNLPDADTLEKVSRYEAHLDRIFVRTLHELQRLQASRSESVMPPPVAVDLTS